MQDVLLTTTAHIAFYPLVGYGYGLGLGSGSVDYFTGNISNGGNHIFYTGATDTSFGTERMRISSTGVGIGTTDTTSNKLNVDGLIRGTKLTVINTAVWDHGRCWHDGATFFMDAGGADSGIAFRIDGAGTTFPSNYVERMRINANGNVSIPTNLTVGNQLTVQDNQNITGDLFITGQVVTGLYVVSQTNTDYCCVQQNYTSIGQYYQLAIKVAYGSFTAFHRCYTDDELYGETDETKVIFKNNYVGRVVIATGKIKTDFTRKKPTEPEPEQEPVIDSETGEPVIIENKLLKIEEDEWYSEIDKDGMTIEDAVPVVRLSRQRKDKRVFGVLGTSTRSTNNKDRLIVNSVGEGGICVSNTNGNIENGDYLQSSDLLGYAEKQDDDLLHNYTIGKATIDCNFELDSPYYLCEEIENGVRVAFIACSYHCG